jgi:hypothetical protein
MDVNASYARHSGQSDFSERFTSKVFRNGASRSRIQSSQLCDPIGMLEFGGGHFSGDFVQILQEGERPDSDGDADRHGRNVDREVTMAPKAKWCSISSSLRGCVRKPASWLFRGVDGSGHDIQPDSLIAICATVKFVHPSPSRRSADARIIASPLRGWT